MKVQICNRCLMLGTRPRLTFSSDGACAACQWAEEKKVSVDWKKRKQELTNFCNTFRSDKSFDVLVPVSGGKDSSMVAHKLKHEYGMNPLCVNINQSIQCNTKLNDINLHNFIDHGFDCLRIYPSPHVLRGLDRIGLVEYGQPYLGWLTAMSLAPLKIAMQYGIHFIMYGEEGEVEYGGSQKLKNISIYSIEDVATLYLSGINPQRFLKNYSEKDLYWWLPPSEEEVRKFSPSLAHWSYFEAWDSNYNYQYAKEHLALKVFDTPSAGTYNNFAQTDSILYNLHTYFMYLKFGFGRCTQDVCIDIRSGELSREEGIALIEQYDEAYPEEFEKQYLEYYQMSKTEFYDVIDNFANKELLIKKNGRWIKNRDRWKHA